jgi:hypothetical protein
VAKDEEIVLIGMDSTVGSRAGIRPGGRLEPGTTA